MTFTIRDAVPADAETIAAFNAAMAEETEDKPLDEATVLAGVCALLDDPTRGRYWLVEDGARIVGQTMATREWSDWRNGWFWWLQSVYIVPEARRQGVFRALYDHVCEAARAAGACGLRLYVEHENTGAQQTYVALGMADAGYAMMEVAFTPDTETA